jgi:hypothetical protein
MIWLYERVSIRKTDLVPGDSASYKTADNGGYGKPGRRTESAAHHM